MSFRLFAFLLASVLVLAGSCAPAEDAGAGAGSGEAAMADTNDSGDPISGTWSGTWGPTPQHRNDVVVDLEWDGTNLTGTVNPGPDAVPLSTATFDPATGHVMMQAMATNNFGQEVHFMIDGQLDGSSMTGSWSHEGTEGDFSISRN
jgi:hypothetical protein